MISSFHSDNVLSHEVENFARPFYNSRDECTSGSPTVADSDSPNLLPYNKGDIPNLGEKLFIFL